MMRKPIILFLFIISLTLKAQIFSGTLYMRDPSTLFLNQVYVTNLNTQKTVLSNYSGNFKIEAKVGDVIRFTSSLTERKDLTMRAETLSVSNNFIELQIGYRIIPEVVIKSFKATGNLKKDVIALKSHEKNIEVAKMIALPAPKGNGLPPELPPLSLANGGLSLSIDGIYDIISGERKKKERLHEYEKMNRNIAILKGYLGDSYFAELKLPKNLVDNFLQFVYTSDNLTPYFERNNLEAIKTSIEKYTPIYHKRLRNSNLVNIAGT